MNPLIELDGYYLLVDLLGRPNLRHDSFARLLNGRLDVIAALYAGGAFVYASALVFIAIPTLVRRLLATSFGPLLPHQLAVALPAVAAGCAALTVIAAIRTAARPAPAATLASGVLGTR